MTETFDRSRLGPDQQYALRSAVRNLGDQFSGVFGAETIERFLYSSYDQFASVARCRRSCRCWRSGSPGSG